MLNPEQQQALDQLLASLNDVQRAWLAGHLNGLVAGQPKAGAASGPPLYLYYATETGNTKVVAQTLEKQARVRGFKTTSTPLSRVKPAELAEKNGPVILLTSTHGEGDPPEMGKRFFEALGTPGSISFKDMRYAVLGLGDHAYAQFCQMAIEFDKHLQAGGGKPFHPLAMFDVDYPVHIPSWMDQVLDALHEGPALTHAPAAPRAAAAIAGSKGFSRLEPVTATVKDTILLSDRGSIKETFHIELAFENGLPYAPGDSLGILLPPELDDKQAPRLYSIASSPLLHAQEIHLTVALSKYSLPNGETGFGRCSRYLTQLPQDAQVQCYVQRNQRFRPPENDAQDVIMIGPGTGIAPFRAFLQERAERGATGRNWLFFGDQHAHCDFLYQSEWQEYLENGTLTHMQAAFSRDQKEKIYVQHRLKERASELLDWLDGGASLYVCGSKSPMSEDVENMLLELVAARHGGKEKARNYLDDLSEGDRYLKDVY
jgi:sulfite reductase (NADPH) flavoprotein alpha-component